MDDLNCYSPLAILTALFSPKSLSLVCAVGLSQATYFSAMRLPRYLVYFAVTCLLEAPFYIGGARQLSPARTLKQILWLNLSTHPLVTFAFPFLFSLAHRQEIQTILTSELFAWTVEAMILRWAYGYSQARALVLSLTANLFSWGMGPYLIRWIYR